jgi:hypothetical protein
LPTLKIAWLRVSQTRNESSPPASISRASSRSARAGTLASSRSATEVSSVVVFTASR